MKNPFPKGFGKSKVKPGESGIWKVQRFKVDHKQVAIENLRAIRDGYRQRIIPPDQYTRLVYTGGVMMSDTPAEAHEHAAAFHSAKDSVLLNGLGLGFFLQAILTKKDVRDVTVIENSADVSKLVAPHFKKERVEIIQADAFDWQPPKGKHFGFVWHDIWPTICEDNLPEMKKLVRKYARRADSQDCWSRAYLRRGL